MLLSSIKMSLYFDSNKHGPIKFLTLKYINKYIPPKNPIFKHGRTFLGQKKWITFGSVEPAEGQKTSLREGEEADFSGFHPSHSVVPALATIAFPLSTLALLPFPCTDFNPTSVCSKNFTFLSDVLLNSEGDDQDRKFTDGMSKELTKEVWELRQSCMLISWIQLSLSQTMFQLQRLGAEREKASWKDSGG